MSVERDKAMVLLVEDEEMIATLVEEELREADFGVIYAPDGLQAQTALISCPNYQAVILDINLPGPISGWELARIARSHSPDIAVVYASGHGELEWRAQGVPRSLLVTKPYLPRELVALLREEIGARTESNGEPKAVPINPAR